MIVPSESWDQSRALYSVGGDAEFLTELAGIFCAACPTLLKSLGEAIAAKNCDTAVDAAHLLGRAARNLVATRVQRTALTVETMAVHKELDDIGKAYYELRQETDRLVAALTDFRTKTSEQRGITGPPQT